MRTQKSLLLLVLCFIPVVALAQRYTVTDLGPLEPTEINSWAQVVGNYNGHAFIWDRRQGMRDLGLLPGGTFSSAADVNGLGVVAGTANGSGTVFSPYPHLDYPNVSCSDLIQHVVWTNGSLQELGTVGFGVIDYSEWCRFGFYPTSINANGKMVGYTAEYGNYYRWGWTNDTTIALPADSRFVENGMVLFGGSWTSTFINGITNAGEIAGQNGIELTYGHAAWWKNGVETDLGPADSFVSSANGINELGQIVGWATTVPIFFGDYYDFISAANCPMHARVVNSKWSNDRLGDSSG